MFPPDEISGREISVGSPKRIRISVEYGLGVVVGQGELDGNKQKS